MTYSEVEVERAHAYLTLSPLVERKALADRMSRSMTFRHSKWCSKCKRSPLLALAHFLSCQAQITDLGCWPLDASGNVISIELDGVCTHTRSLCLDLSIVFSSTGWRLPPSNANRQYFRSVKRSQDTSVATMKSKMSKTQKRRSSRKRRAIAMAQSPQTVAIRSSLIFLIYHTFTIANRFSSIHLSICWEEPFYFTFNHSWN